MSFCCSNISLQEVLLEVRMYSSKWGSCNQANQVDLQISTVATIGAFMQIVKTKEVNDPLYNL